MSTPPSSPLDMLYLVRALLKYGASDLHLKVGRPPLFRVNGQLVASKLPELTFNSLKEIIDSVLTPRHRELLEEQRQVDFSFRIKDLGRFRANLYYQRDSIAAAIRMIPLAVPEFAKLGLPQIIKDLCARQQGLVLITGATGSGKSTTLAAMIQEINETQSAHVLCIEDPIEFIFKDRRSTVSQREVGTDTSSISDALRAGLRQDPDVIMIGELRDFESIRTAMTAAETGHLVLATLHTQNAVGSIERILESFPPEAKNQARAQLASTLAAIVSQQLITRADGNGRVMACEVLIKSPLIESKILREETSSIEEVLESSGDYYQMQSFNQALEHLIRTGVISSEDGVRASPRPDDLKLRLSGLVREQGYEVNAVASPRRSGVKSA